MVKLELLFLNPLNEKELLINYLSDKVLYDLKNEDLAPDALKVTEKKMKYLIKNQNGK